MNKEQHIPNGYKISELGVIPEDWEVKRLGDLCDFLSGGTPSKENSLYWNGYIPWISASSMHNQKIQDSNLKITDLGLQNGSKLAIKDSLLLLVRGSMLWNRIPICICLRDVAFNQDVKCLNANKQTSNKYLLYWFSANENILLHMVVGTGIGAGKLELSDLKSLNVILPPINEQERIVEVLSTWDKAIENQSKMIDLLERRKRALMQRLLTGKTRLPGFSEPWRKVRLGNICDIKKGKSLSAKDVTNGIYKVIAGGKTSPYSHNEYTDENIITISASGAYAGFVAYHNYKIWASDCSVIRDICDKSNIQYLYYLLSYNQEYIYSLQTGGAQPHVFPKDIYGLEYKFPKIEEQEAIAEILNFADREIDFIKCKLETFCIQKQSLMQQLLTGKKRLKYVQ